MMRKQLLVTLILTAFTAVIAIGGKVHPNEKLIVGKWIPVKVEKYVPEKKKDTSAPARSETGENKSPDDQKLERLLRAEQKATLEITSDRTAMKNYHGKLIKASWKLKGGGKKIVARDISTKEKYILNIVEVTDTQMILIENSAAGSITITYKKE
jgi:hypothetical protein